MKFTNAYTSLANGSASHDQLWEIIMSVREGSGIEELRVLFHSESPPVIASLGYIAYEAGSAMQPLRNEVASLLGFSCPQVRSDAVICLAKCVSHEDRSILGGMMACLVDEDEFVHRSILSFVASQTAGLSKLIVALEEVCEIRPEPAFPYILDQLKQVRNQCSIPEIVGLLLKNDDPLVQRFGVGLACRATLIVDLNLLDMAGKCKDDSGRDYARIRRDLPVLGSATNARISEYSARRRRES